MERSKKSFRVKSVSMLRIVILCFGALFLLTILGSEGIISYRLKGDFDVLTILQIDTSAGLGLIVLALLACRRLQKNHALVLAAFVVTTLYYLLYFIASIYRLVMGGSLDVFFAWLNRDEIIATVSNTLGGPTVWFVFLLLIVLLVAALMIFYDAIYQRAQHGRASVLAKQWLAGLFVITIALAFAGSLDTKPELYRFIGHVILKRTSALESVYTDEYLAQLTRSHASPVPTTSATETRPNLIVLHLESLNAGEINDTTTPNFLRAAKEGVFIPAEISQTVNTIRAEEVLLCSILPTPGDTIVKQANVPVPRCLANILTNAGYNTAFFKSDDLAFASTGDFATLAGFETSHQRDIMKDTDPEAEWGFREDIFYHRVSDYVSQNLSEPFFAYIAVSTTNHYPYEYPEGFHVVDKQTLPFAEPQNFAEEYSNAIYLQDDYLGTALDWLEQSGLRDTSYVFITGDHPSPVVPNNKAPLLSHRAYENVFKTSAVLLPPRTLPHPFPLPMTYNHYVSHADILPTFLELLGFSAMPTQGTSVVQSLVHNEDLPRCIVSLQPFGDRYLSLVRYPQKTLYNFFQGTAENFDLSQDPEGIHPLSTRAINEGDVENFKSCIR